MKKLTIREARKSLTNLDRLLALEGEVTITRRGEAIARMVQIGQKRPIPSHRDLREKMARMRKGSRAVVGSIVAFAGAVAIANHSGIPEVPGQVLPNHIKANIEVSLIIANYVI